MWRLSTHDFLLNEDEEVSVRLGPDGSSELSGSDQFLVLVEDLIGRGESFEATLDLDDGQTGDAEANEEGGPRRVFFGAVDSLSGVVVTLRARLTGFFRISIARLKKHLEEDWKELPCDLCKKLAKILARAIVAWLGLGMPSDVGAVSDKILDLDIRSVLKDIGGTALWRWVSRSGLEPLTMLLLGPLFSFLRTARAAEEWIYLEACTAAGACKRV